jgi:hypothetical protein
MIVDRQADKQFELERQRLAAATGYPALWTRLIEEWRSPGDDRLWLVYSANYLFRTGGVRWALDPLTLKQRLPETNAVDIAGSLSGLSFVLLTHQHADHLDLALIRALRAQPICWVVPRPIFRLVLDQAGLSPSRVFVPQMLEPLRIGGVKITPFEGLHWDAPQGDLPPHGVPSVGYLVEFGGKRWLFPGDTRTYDASRLPDFGPLDGVFAHLWLGRGCALHEEPPLLEAFCSFFLSLQAKQIVVTHLQELGRPAEECWTLAHCARVEALLRQRQPEVSVRCALMGESVGL